MQVNQLSDKHLNAIQSWASLHGRNWKSALNLAWMSGNYGSVAFIDSLQQIRNQFGPSWLVKFSLKKAIAAQLAALRPDEPQILEVQGKPVYKIVQTIAGKMVPTLATNIYAWAQTNGREVYHVDRVSHLRPELQVQPRVQGLCGPMWDGFNAEGNPVVRYEDQASYDTLSA